MSNDSSYVLQNHLQPHAPLRTLRQLSTRDRVSAKNATQRCELADSVVLALDPWQRLRGLIGRPALGEGQAMLLRPCAAVHTWWMRYSIDVLFLNDQGVVVSVCAQLAPWRTSGWQHGAKAVLELAAGVIEASRTHIGDQVVFVRRG